VSDTVSKKQNENSPTAATSEGTLLIPVIEECLDVSKELKTAGIVHVHKSIREHDVLVSEPLTAETVHVERIPMDRIVEAPPVIRTEGEVTVIPVVEEVLVTTKQLRLVEEVRITKVRSTIVHQENVTLRSEEVSVSRETPVSSLDSREE